MQVIPAITPLNGSLSVADTCRLGQYLHASIIKPATVEEPKQLNVYVRGKRKKGKDNHGQDFSN